MTKQFATREFDTPSIWVDDPDGVSGVRLPEAEQVGLVESIRKELGR